MLALPAATDPKVEKLALQRAERGFYLAIQRNGQGV